MTRVFIPGTTVTSWTVLETPASGPFLHGAGAQIMPRSLADIEELERGVAGLKAAWLAREARLQATGTRDASVTDLRPAVAS